MMEIQLEAPEILMLRKILASYLGDLRMEIAATDSMDFREELKREETFIKELLERLGAPV